MKTNENLMKGAEETLEQNWRKELNIANAFDKWKDKFARMLDDFVNVRRPPGPDQYSKTFDRIGPGWL